MLRYSVIIPARFASERLPGKPLLDIAGKPMIQRVYEQVRDLGAQRVLPCLIPVHYDRNYHLVT